MIPTNLIPRIIAIVLSFALVGTHADMALAADVRTARAKKHFKQGQSHYANGEFGNALEEFEAAYSYKTLSGFLYNMGQCHMELKNHAMALKLFNQYLRATPRARNREKVEERMREASAALKNVPAESPKKVVVLAPAPTPVPTKEHKVVEEIPLAPLVAPIAEPPLAALSPTTGVQMDALGESDAFYETWWFWSIATSLVAASVSAVVITQTSPTEQLVAPSGTLGSIDRR